MELCKGGDESLGNSPVLNEDRISQLPEALLLQILSLLPTEKVVATSVLSKRWRTLWKVVPKLKFTCHRSNDLEIFSDYVCKTLLSHQAPVLQSLHLEIHGGNEGSSLDIGVLIGIAFGIHVRKFVLNVSYVQGLFRFPRSLYNCETLEALKLIGSILVNVPFPVCLKSLRTLHLRVDACKDDDESVVNLLNGCSRLENLVVTGSYYMDVKTFTIDVPSLQRLTMYLFPDGAQPYVIKAPSLKYLKIDGSVDFEPLFIGNTSDLEEANINISGTIGDCTMRSLTSAKRFFLASRKPLLREEPEWWNLLMPMLNASPNLQVLTLFGSCYDGEDGVAYNKKCNQPKNAPDERLLPQLHTLVWEYYEGHLDEEKEVLKYIFRNACFLKKATFMNLLGSVEELESVAKASDSCQLVFE